MGGQGKMGHGRIVREGNAPTTHSGPGINTKDYRRTASTAISINHHMLDAACKEIRNQFCP